LLITLTRNQWQFLKLFKKSKACDWFKNLRHLGSNSWPRDMRPLVSQITAQPCWFCPDTDLRVFWLMANLSGFQISAIFSFWPFPVRIVPGLQAQNPHFLSGSWHGLFCYCRGSWEAWCWKGTFCPVSGPANLSGFQIRHFFPPKNVRTTGSGLNHCWHSI
jgi:hypothetical protein